ncbi:MAG TPA: CRTAC1 family protein, partial [Vicinamibacterales bacterium]|nr:CRTAC1 family protein [Vicinamibacterales bacterium]
QLFHNAGGGRLADVTASAGGPFEKALVGRGLATGDIDNDGDVDVLITANGGPVRLLLNDSTQGHWLTVGVGAPSGNRLGFGARVGVVRQGQPILWRRAGTDGSYLSASDARVHFGLGSSSRIDRVIVEWPDGLHEHWSGIPVDKAVQLIRGTGTTEARK